MGGHVLLASPDRHFHLPRTAPEQSVMADVRGRRRRCWFFAVVMPLAAQGDKRPAHVICCRGVVPTHSVRKMVP